MAPDAKPDGGVQVSVGKTVEHLNANDRIVDDFVSTFLQAGVTPNNIENHSVRSVRGLIYKYTIMHGGVGTGKWIRETPEKSGNFRKG